MKTGNRERTENEKWYDARDGHGVTKTKHDKVFISSWGLAEVEYAS